MNLRNLRNLRILRWAAWLLLPGAWLVGLVTGLWLIWGVRRAERLHLRRELEARHAIEAFASEKITIAALELVNAEYEMACARRAWWRAKCSAAGIPPALVALAVRQPEEPGYIFAFAAPSDAALARAQKQIDEVEVRGLDPARRPGEPIQ